MHELLRWRVTLLEITVHCYVCEGFGYLWHQDTSATTEELSNRRPASQQEYPGGGLPVVPPGSCVIQVEWHFTVSQFNVRRRGVSQRFHPKQGERHSNLQSE